jgi:hypothetical protein
MFIRGTYTEAKRASAGNSTDKIDLDVTGGGYDGLIITSSLTGVVTAYIMTESAIQDDESPPFTTGIEFPASTAAGSYNIFLGAVKCATAADAKKLIVVR